jgi:hypothetical protein
MDLSGISTEDLMALKGGDLSKVSTAGLQALKQASVHAAASEDTAAWQKTINPTDGMGFMDKFNAGAGRAFADIGTGVGQRLGLVSYDDVKERRKLDAPLMQTGAAKAGNIGANLAMLAPATLLPGAATVPGAAVIGGLTGMLQPAASGAEVAINTGLGAAGGAGGQAVANKAAGSVAFQESRNAMAAAQGAQKAEAARNARSAGYVVPPEDLGGGLVTKLMQGVGGKIKTAQAASQDNQPVTNALARKALGLAETDPLNPKTLTALRDAAGNAYDVVKQSGTITADAAYGQALDKIAQKYTTALQAFPGAVKSDIPDMVAALKQPAFGADGAVEMTKVLRQNADKAFASGDKGAGKAFKEASDALEAMMERHLQASGQPEALKALQEARQLIAKSYTVQKALNPTTGDVSAQTLAKELAKGKPLTNELQIIAQAGQAFPKATQALKETPKTFSPLDMALAAMKNDPTALLTLGARPAARSIMLSGPVQNRMVNAMSQPAPANALTRILAQDYLTMPGGVAGGVGAGNALTAYLAQK